MAGQPALYCGRFVSGGIVDDEVHVQFVGDLAVNEVQEALELSGPVTSGEVADHLA